MGGRVRPGGSQLVDGVDPQLLLRPVAYLALRLELVRINGGLDLLKQVLVLVTGVAGQYERLFAGERRQDEPEGNAESAATRGDRERALRHRSAALPTGSGAAVGPGDGCSGRPALRLRRHLRSGRRSACDGDGVGRICAVES